MAQRPAELEVTVKEVALLFPLLLFPSSSCPWSRQRRNGASWAWEEHLQCRPWASQEQKGPSSCRGAGKRAGKTQQDTSLLLIIAGK